MLSFCERTTSEIQEDGWLDVGRRKKIMIKTEDMYDRKTVEKPETPRESKISYI